VAKEISKVSVDDGGTACKIPNANDYIDKAFDMRRVGKKLLLSLAWQGGFHSVLGDHEADLHDFMKN
jgi:hypothetical protein